MHTQKRKIITILLATIVFFSGCQSKKDDSLFKNLVIYELVKPWDARITDTVHGYMLRKGIVGGAVAVVRKGETIYSQGFGMADKAANIKMTPATVVMVGSISKLMTATSVMQLHEKGKLDIDTAFTRYVTDFSIKARKGMTTTVDNITPRQMLSHQSGLPSDWFHDQYTAFPPGLTEYAGQFADEYLASEPNIFYSYSNTAFTLLGLLVERVSGVSFSAYTDNNLFQAAAMNSSSFAPTEAMKVKKSKGYNADGTLALDPVIAEIPAGALHTTADDMAAFMKMVLADGKINDTQILAKTTLDAMLTEQNAKRALPQNQTGLGWSLAPYQLSGQGKTISHAGNIHSFNAMMLIFPEHQTGIFVVFNTVGSGMTAVSLARDIGKIVMQQLNAVEVRNSYDVSSAEIAIQNPESYAGKYSIPFVGTVEIKQKNDKLSAFVLGQNIPLTWHEDGKFRMPLPGAEVSFAEYQGKKAFTLYLGEQTSYLPIQGIKIENLSVTSAWKNRTGVYSLDSQTTFNKILKPVRIELKETDGVLYAVKTVASGDTEQSNDFALEIDDDTTAHFYGADRGMGETIWIDSQGKMHYQESTYSRQ